MSTRTYETRKPKGDALNVVRHAVRLCRDYTASSTGPCTTSSNGARTGSGSYSPLASERWDDVVAFLENVA